MFGFFQTSRFYFLVDDTQTVCDLEPSHPFDAEFVSTFDLPALDGKPIASWFIARLSYLTEGRLGILDGETQCCDVAVCILEVLVYDAMRLLIAKIQVQAGDRAVFLGHCRDTVDHNNLLAEFRDTVLRDAHEVRPFVIHVLDTDNGARRTYGYLDGEYL